MKNNRGLTLVELLGVLVVLSIVVMIVTPTVTRNLKSSQVELCYHQLDSLEAASKNWLTDQINDNYDEMFVNGVFSDVIVDGNTLLRGGYVDSLEDKYKNVQIEISKVGNNYTYVVLNRSTYCE